jgi:hypothetical protein
MILEVLMAVKMLILVIWVVTPCRLVGRYQHFRGTYCLFCVATQKTNIDRITPL